MIFDDLDLFILVTAHKYGVDNKRLFIGDIIRDYYLDSIKDRYDYTQKNNFLARRLKSIEKGGLITISKEGWKKYLELNFDRVVVGKHKFEKKAVDSVMIKDLHGKWMAFQI